MHTKPRPSLSMSLVTAAVICIVCIGTAAQAQSLLDPLTLTKFVDPLPNPLANVISPVDSLDGMDLYEVSMTQFSQQLHDELDPTTVWGYNGTYPGPTFEVQRDQPVKVEWINSLVDGVGAPLPHLLPLDTSVHGAETTVSRGTHRRSSPRRRGRARKRWFPRALVYSRPDRPGQWHGRPGRQ